MEPVFDVPLDVSPPATPIAAHISAVMCGVPVVFLFIFESARALRVVMLRSVVK